MEQLKSIMKVRTNWGLQWNRRTKWAKGQSPTLTPSSAAFKYNVIPPSANLIENQNETRRRESVRETCTSHPYDSRQCFTRIFFHPWQNNIKKHPPVGVAPSRRCSRPLVRTIPNIVGEDCTADGKLLLLDVQARVPGTNQRLVRIITGSRPHECTVVTPISKE